MRSKAQHLANRLKHAERNRRVIVPLVLDKKVKQSKVAVTYHLSRQRVHQIVKRARCKRAYGRQVSLGAIRSPAKGDVTVGADHPFVKCGTEKQRARIDGPRRKQ